MSLRSLRIGTRVWLGFGSAMLGLVPALGAVEFNRLELLLRSQAAVSARSGLATASELQTLAKANAIDSLHMLVSPNEDQQKKLAQGLAQRNQAIVGKLGRLEQLADDAQAPRHL